MEFKDYYRTLGVPRTATGKDLKQAYRKLARKFHPDVNPGDKKAEARFKEINEAYEVLGDPEKRRKYDELGANWRMYEQAQQPGPAGGWQPFGGDQPSGGGWQVNTGGAPGGYRTMSEEEMRRIFGDSDPFSDFFKTFFGGGGEWGARPGRRAGGGRGGRARAGRDLEHDVELSLEEAFRGATRRLSIARAENTRTVDVRIPAGVDEGSRVRVGGEGEPALGGGKAGDLYLRVHLRPDPHFDRRGRDLHARVAVPVTIAVLGGEVQVPTIGGSRLRLKIPPGTQNGQVFRLKGQGMPIAGNATARGDLYATVDVQIPRDLTADQRAHYEALARMER